MAFKWTSENCLNLIDNYRQHPCIWNPKKVKYKCRESKNDAWNAVCSAVGCLSQEETKRKIRHLVGQFYRERKKYRSMKKSGAGAHFHSKWFAYDALVFIRDKNKVRPCRESEAENVDDLNDSSSETDLDYSQVTDCDECGNETQEFQDVANGNQGMEDLSNDGSQKPSTSNAACQEPSASNKASQEPRKETVENPNSTNLDEFKHPNKTRRVTQTLKSQIDDNARKEEAYKIIQNIQNKRQRDKFDVFGEHMACKIRDLNTTCAQNIVEHLISNILFDASMGKYDYGMPQSTNTYEPILSMQPFTRPQSHSSNCSTPATSPVETYIQNSSDSSTAFGTSNIIAEAFQLSNM